MDVDESHTKDPAGRFAPPIPSLLQRPIEFDGAGTGAIVDAGAAIPAPVRMQDDGAFSLLGIRDEHVHRALLNTCVAPVA